MATRAILALLILLILPSPLRGRGQGEGDEGQMLRIPPGPFRMGWDKRMPDEGPMHLVYTGAYWMDRHEVTNAQYREFIMATGRRPPAHWRGGAPPPRRAQHPVVYMTWYDAREFCRWAGKRLPTEAEWEKAARGPDGRIFPWGNAFDPSKANTPQTGIGDTMPVGSFEDGKSPYGLYDMAGNVYEWTASWYLAYPANARPSENYGRRFRVVRGGSYVDCEFYRCGLSAPTFNRAFFVPETRNSGFGFRCARSETP